MNVCRRHSSLCTPLYHFVYEMKFSQSKYKHISQLHTNLLKNFDKMLFLDEVELILARK